MSIARKGTCNSFSSLIHVHSFILFSFTGPNFEIYFSHLFLPLFLFWGKYDKLYGTRKLRENLQVKLYGDPLTVKGTRKEKCAKQDRKSGHACEYVYRTKTEKKRWIVKQKCCPISFKKVKGVPNKAKWWLMVHLLREW